MQFLIGRGDCYEIMFIGGSLIICVLKRRSGVSEEAVYMTNTVRRFRGTIKVDRQRRESRKEGRSLNRDRLY